MIDRSTRRAVEKAERRLGKQLLRRCEEARTKIEVSAEEEKTFFRGVYPEPQNLTLLPPFDSGSMFVHYQDYDGFLRWEVRKINDDDIDLDLLIGYDRDEPLFVGSISVKVPLKIFGYYHDYERTGIGSPLIAAMMEKNFPEKEIDAEAEKLTDLLKPIFHLFIRTFAWFNFLLDNPDYKTANKTSDTTADVNGLSVEADAPKIKKIASKQRQRICSLWSVSGHFRRYKSGKIVYIAPYMKGKNRDLVGDKSFRNGGDQA